MQTLEIYQWQLARSDAGLLQLSILLLVCIALFLFSWRRVRWFRVIGRHALPLAIPLTTLPFSLPFAAASAAVSSIRFKFQFNQLWIILAGAALLRFPPLFDSLWYDEAFTWSWSRLALAQFPAAVLSDVHPPTHYLISWLMMNLFGSSDLVLRLPEYIAGVAAVALMFRLVMAMKLGRSVALWAAALIALGTSAVYYSTDARPYSLMVCAVFTALIFLFEGKAYRFALAAALIPWMHNLGFFYLLVLLPGAAVYHRFNHRWLLACVLARLGAAALLPITIAQTSIIADGFWIRINPGYTLWPLVQSVMAIEEVQIVALLIPAFVLVVLGVWSARLLLRLAAFRLVLLLALGVPSIVALISFIWKPVYLQRPLLACSLLLFIPLAWVLDQHSERVLARASVSAWLLVALAVFYTTPNNRPDYRTAIVEGCQGATAYYATSAVAAFLGSRYLEDLPVVVWPGSQDIGGTFPPEALANYGFTLGDIDQLAGQRVCVWMIRLPQTTAAELALVDQLQARGAVLTHSTIVDPETQWLLFYQVDL